MIKDFWLIFNIIISTIIFSTLVCIAGLFDSKKKITGKLIQLWAKWILYSSFIKYTINGLDNIDIKKNYVIISNHQSSMDVILTFALFPKPVSFFTKKELFYIPLFGWAMYSAGMVKVDRFNKSKSKQCVDDAIEKYKKTMLSFLVYPEGTRTSYDKLHEFKKGGFIFAIEANAEILPLTIIYDKNNFSKLRSNATLLVDSPISTLNYNFEQKDDLIVRIKEVIKSNLEKHIDANI